MSSVAPLSRRQRLLLRTGLLSAAFLVAAGAFAWWRLRPKDVYRPGEGVEGLTTDLVRALPADHPRVTFTDVTRAAGITWRNFAGTRTSQLPEDMGAGAAWGDFDGDGWVDLAIANDIGPMGMSEAARRASPARAMLYRNNGDGTFTDVTDRARIDVRGMGMAAAWADYDNDGHPDLLFTAYGHNVLYHNNGDGTFTDVSTATGIGVPLGFWTGAAWGDYDRDGRLDLYVTGYVQYTTNLSPVTPGLADVENPASINPSSFAPERNLLFHNRGNGTFEEVGARAGVQGLTGRGLVATWIDVDGDGWPDLYVGDDVSNNILYRNLGNGRFADITLATRIADYRSTMGMAVGDWNGDGQLDLYLTHWLAQGNALYDRVPGAQVYMDESDRFGLGQVSLDFIAWGTSFADYDNDGWLDLFVINGSTLQRRADPTRLMPMRPQLFWNRGATEGFFEVSRASGAFFDSVYVGRGLALADYDNDGDIDAFVTTNGGGAYLLRNDGGNARRWLQVELRGTTGNRQGIGATMRLVANGRSQVRRVGVQAPYLSQNSLVETFGLGNADRADTLEITWTDGRKQLRTGVAAGQRLIVTEAPDADGTVAPARGAAVTAGTSPVMDRDRLQRFWTLMRQATTERIAGHLSDASASYDQALAINAAHEDALYYAGSMRLAVGNFAGAAAAWRTLLAVNPNSARTYSQLGNLYLCLDDDAPFQPDSAARHFQRAHDINREETGSLLHLGETALLRGDAAGATRLLQSVLATHDASAPAHFYLGFLAWKRGDTETAVQEYARARALPAAAATAGVPGEGDTRTGAPMRALLQRCGTLRTLSTGGGPDEMPARYRQLDSVVARARARVR